MSTHSKITIPIDPSDPKFAIENLPFHWIIKLSNCYTQLIEDKTKKEGLTINAWRVGITLKEYGTLSVTEIADHVSGRVPTITKTISRMHDMGLVRLRSSKSDGRVTEVSITSKGEKLIDQLVDDRIELYQRAFDGLSDYELMAVNSVLKRIFKNLFDR